MRIFFLAVLVGCGSTQRTDPRNELTPELEADLEAALIAAQEEQGLPGLAMAVAYHDTDQLWVGTTGLADIDTSEPWTEDRTFRIGSVTKTFTTATIFQLVEEGTVSLDDPVDQWIEGYWTGPTVRDLLGHSSGIASYNYIGSFPSGDEWTPEELVGWAWDREPDLRFTPGSDWEYSNTNYVLLGLVIEAASGQSYAQALDARFLGPLALGDTQLDPAGDRDPRLVRSYTGSPPVDHTFADDPSMGWAAGGMSSTPADLARWSSALFGGDVLSADSHAAMVTPRGLTGPDESEYGLGAFYEGEDDLEIFGHTGGIGGFATYAYHLRDPSVSVIILSNHQETDLRAASMHPWSAILGVN